MAAPRRLGPDDYDNDAVADGDNNGWDEEQHHGDDGHVQLTETK